jgi:hypothetical protein
MTTHSFSFIRTNYEPFLWILQLATCASKVSHNFTHNSIGILLLQKKLMFVIYSILYVKLRIKQ